MSPTMAGGLVGLGAGAAMLGVVHAIVPGDLERAVAAASAGRGVSSAVGFAVAYVTAIALGGLVGGVFAHVTRYLRKWLPLSIWAAVFFSSFAVVVLSAAIAGGRAGDRIAGPVLIGSVLFGLLLSFSLPIRRRR